MALSKSYTLQDVESILRVLLHEVTGSNLQSLSIKDIINKNTLDLCEMLNGSQAPDYGEVAIVSEELNAVRASYSSFIAGVLNEDYTTADEPCTILKQGHGFTLSDIGRRVIVYHTTGDMVITYITSIVDGSNFEIANNPHGHLGDTVHYLALGFSLSETIDLSALRIDKIIKLVDETNGLISPKGDFDFENVRNFPQYQDSVFYNYFGETLYLFKGSNIQGYGTIRLYYYRLPKLVVSGTDYIDVKDKYIPLLIDKCKLEIFEMLNKQPPKELTQNVDSKTIAIRQAGQSKESHILSKQTGQ